MKRNISFYLLIVFFSSLIITIQAQDSLYLVGTIVGESTEHHIGSLAEIGDVNGDGYDDFALPVRTGNSASDQGIIKLFFGSPDFDLNADIIFHYPGNDILNELARCYGIGDINNDGYDDFVLCGGFGDWGFYKGKVFLYYGGKTIDTIPVAEFYQPNSIQDDFGYPVESLGDINKDGYDDFAISSGYNWSDGKGYVYLFWGGDTISWSRSLTFTSDTLEDFFGTSIANIDDINNDEFDDIAIGATGGPGTMVSGKVYIYYGSIELDNEPDTILVSDTPGDLLGSFIKNADDLNGDGKIDFCMAQGYYINVYTNGLNNPTYIKSGYWIDTGGDINNDGFSDIIIGDEQGIKVLLGSAIFDTTSDIIVYDIDSSGFVRIVNYAGDINKDGYDDIFWYLPQFPDPDNPLGKVFIYSYKKIISIHQSEDNHPDHFQLYQNYPNPFNPTTIIYWQIESRAYVLLTIYDILGNKIITLIDEERPAGNYSTEFDASKYHLSSGIYFCKLKIRGGGSATIKMVLLR